MAFWRILVLLSALCRTDALKVYPPDQVAFLGRWHGGRFTSRRCSWGTASFAVSFRGSSQLVARLQPYNVKMYHTCQVNDGSPFVLEHQSGDLVIAENLEPSAMHRISCGRNTEAFYGATILDALLVDEGAVILSPPRWTNDLAVEFLGDSITAGWQVLAPRGSTESGPSVEDVFKTWAKQLAKAWGTSNWRTVAQSSIGVLPHQSYGLSFKGMKDQFICADLTMYQPCQQLWDFDLWQADVVAINLGTNDFALNNPSEEEFQTAYLDLIRMVRSKYPSALVFCIIPLAYSCKSGPEWQQMANGITNAARAAGPDVELLVTPGPGEEPWLNCQRDYRDDLHPTERGFQLFAYHLSKLMLPKLKERFPWKCRNCGEVPLPGETTPAATTTAATTTAATTTTVGGTSPPGGPLCCYPSCGDAQRSCNTEEDSVYCTSSADNCRNCGGEFCGAPGTTEATQPSTTTVRTAPATTTATAATTTTDAVTTREATTTEAFTTSAATGQQCCYPDCGSSVCNPPDNYCSQSSGNCQNCGGSLCGASPPRTTELVTRPPSSQPASTQPTGASRCCYPDCDSNACNEPDESPFCTSSPENCRKCGGELCSHGGLFL